MTHPTTTPKPRAYTIAQVAQLLQVPYRQIYNSVTEGRMNAFRVGRHWRIPDHELERLLHSADHHVA
jgi:excisionase family DNA binding protein